MKVESDSDEEVATGTKSSGGNMEKNTMKLQGGNRE